MPRDEHGFLKADALKQGLREQFSTVRNGYTYTVEIVWDPYMYKGYAVKHAIAIEEHVERRVTHYGDDLSGAQRAFTKLVRALGGRA